MGQISNGMNARPWSWPWCVSRLNWTNCFGFGRTTMAKKKTLTPDDREKVVAILRDIRDEVRNLRLRLERRG